MKKLALLIIFMTIFAFTSFAQVDVTVTGKSELTLGIALDDPVASGFTNKNESKIAFTLVSGDSEKGGDADVYGYIKIKGWKAEANSADGWKDLKAGDVEAKIVFAGGWVKISGTNASTNFINIVQNDNAVKDKDDKGVNTSIPNSGGLVVGLDLAPAAIEIGLFSENDWTDTNTATAATDAEYGWIENTTDPALNPTWGIVTAAGAAGADTDDINDEHAYGASLKVTLDVAPIKVEAAVAMGLNYVVASDIGIGGKVTADIAPLKIYAGADVKVPDGADAQIEAGLGVSVAVMDGVDIAVDATYGVEDVDNTDVRIGVTANDLVAGLKTNLTLELFNLLGAVGDDTDDDVEWSVAAGLSYALATAKPYLNIRYGTFTAKDNAYTYAVAGQEPFKLNVGVDLTMIPDVTFTLDYNSDDLTSDAKSNGVFKIKTTIKY
jgi:hypothetical protein